VFTEASAVKGCENRLRFHRVNDNKIKRVLKSTV